MSKQLVQGRPWTPHEDRLLTEAVSIHGDNTEKWKIIALCVPGRTNKACRKRWLHSLSPNVKKSAWTLEEDRQLLFLFEKYPNKWSQIARGIPGRTDDACSKRYREALDPKLKKDDWSEEEDGRLLDSIARHTTASANPKWVLIGQELGRSSLGCRNRWRLLERKKNAAAREKRDLPMQFPEDPTMPRFLAEVWSPFTENDSGSLWSAAWESLNFCTTTNDSGGEVQNLPPMIAGGSQPSVGGAATPAMTQSPSTCAPEAQSISPMSLVTFAASGSSSDSTAPGLPEEQRDYEELTGAVNVDNCAVSLHNDVHTEVDYDISHDEPIVSAGTNAGDSQMVDGTAHLVATPESRIGTISNNIRDVGGSQSVFRINYTNQSSESSSLSDQHPMNEHVQNIGNLTIGSGQEQSSQVVPRPRKKRRAGDEPGPSIQVVTMVMPILRAQKPPKLSSNLPVVSDSSVLAYVCGHSLCWPTASSESTARFATSGELHNHFKDAHLDDPNGGDETPFRCGLKGCRKAWKSINGLQYHLQVSKSHYQRALSSAVPVQAPSTAIVEESSEKTKRKQHRCPHADCPNAYKQLSGLRYHLLHGHPRNPPTQLDLVPPAVARRFGVETDLVNT